MICLIHSLFHFSSSFSFFFSSFLYASFFFFFSSRRRHTRWTGDWSSDVCSSDLARGRRIVMMCKVGARSAEAGRLARAAGYTDVVNLDGGVMAWVREVDPTQPVY